jgi:hypothetical protein
MMRPFRVDVNAERRSSPSPASFRAPREKGPSTDPPREDPFFSDDGDAGVFAAARRALRLGEEPGSGSSQPAFEPASFEGDGSFGGGRDCDDDAHPTEASVRAMDEAYRRAMRKLELRRGRDGTIAWDEESDALAAEANALEDRIVRAVEEMTRARRVGRGEEE